MVKAVGDARMTDKLLRNITVLVARTGCPLYVLFVNQRLYALLDERDAWSEPRLRLTQHLTRHSQQSVHQRHHYTLLKTIFLLIMKQKMIKWDSR